jgi:error-prone DNA polymerase
VPLFQEQAMRLAMVAARFSPEEANGLRRAMATFRHVGTIHTFEKLMVGRMIARGYDPQFAKSCFEQIKGFGSYGFPESHAASFAQLVYASSWIKCLHPDVFCCGLLNSQPMGFYAPAQIVRDAREHGVEVRDIDVSYSFSNNILEERRAAYHPVRLGFRQIGGFRWVDRDEAAFKRAQAGEQRLQVAITPDPSSPGRREQATIHPRSERPLEDWGDIIVAARQRERFTSIEDFARRTALPKHALMMLADADAFRSLGLDRRAALWAVRRLPNDLPLPLFEAANARDLADEAIQPLPDMALSEQVVTDYQTIRLSLKGHPMQFLRPMFDAEQVWPCARVSNTKRNGPRAACAGVVLVRQRPGSASGVVFMTLEDETGIANIVVWPSVLERFRKEVMGARLVVVSGTIQASEEGVVHLIAERLSDRGYELQRLSETLAPAQRALPSGYDLIEPLNDDRRDHPKGSATQIRHPRDVRILPPSRDFH